MATVTLFDFLCCLLGSVSLVYGQTLYRLASPYEPDGTDHTGEIISFSDVGPAVDSDPPAWYCYTSSPSGVRWDFPNGGAVPIVFGRAAVGDELFISSVGNTAAVVLHRGPTHFSPDGEYCCTRNDNTLRKCVTFTPCPTLSSLSNGTISYDPDTNMATYSCDTGYNISGATPITCMGDGTSAGTWSLTPPAPTCTIVTCPVLPAPTNGGVSNPSLDYQGVVTYSCDTGFVLAGSATRQCQATGQWSGVAPTCPLVDCGQPTAPSNGEVSMPVGTTFNNVAHYSCHSCYRRLGVSLRICGGNGLWIPAQPSCEILGCDQPPDLENGITITPYTTTCSSIVTYSCDRGYLLEGVSSRSCQTNEEWSNGTTLCNPIDCGSLSSPDRGTVLLSGSTFMSRANYSCDSGYPLRGPAVRTCGPDGRWSQYSPSCEPVDCGALMNPTNGGVDTSSGTIFMNRATYTCNVGHNLVGTSSRMCLASGNWSSVQPTCEVVDCGALEDLTNGIVVILQGTTFGQSVVYSCNEGFTLNGDARRTCTVNGNWTGSAPSCDPVDCGGLDAPANGHVTTSQGTHFMDTALYSCSPGYNLTGCSEAVCQSNATWSCNPPFCADNTMIQLKFGPTSYCVEWNDEKVKMMYEIMHIAITKAIEKSGHDIPMNNIQPGYFICYESTTRTTYRTTITGTKSVSAVNYAEVLEEWVESGVTTRLLWYAIRMDKACPVVIDSMDQDECEV